MKEPISSSPGLHNATNVMEDVRAGTGAVLRLFVANAANIFLLEVPADKPLLLEEQVDMSK